MLTTSLRLKVCPRYVREFALLCFVLLLSVAAAQAQTAITSVNVYRQTNGNPPGYIVEINGTNLLAPVTPQIIVFPSSGVTTTPLSMTAALIRVSLAVPADYVPAEVVLSYVGAPAVSQTLIKNFCDPKVDVKSEMFYVPQEQVAKKYGHGVAAFFDVIQVSVVNKCALPVLIPLAGVAINYGTKRPAYPFSLDHVTSIYSNDRQFSGPRAIFFNSVLAAATIGSAIQPFFGHGFAQGVAILGGGFTQASAAIWKDLSAEQLQNLTSQSFQSTEQVGPNGGALQKNLFVPKKAKKDTALAESFRTETVGLEMQIIPVLTPTTPKS